MADKEVLDIIKCAVGRKKKHHAGMSVMISLVSRLCMSSKGESSGEGWVDKQRLVSFFSCIPSYCDLERINLHHCMELS